MELVKNRKEELIQKRELLIAQLTEIEERIMSNIDNAPLALIRWYFRLKKEMESLDLLIDEK